MKFGSGILEITLGLATVTVSACHSSIQDQYAASADCVANETAMHAFIDQQSDPNMMMPTDRMRFLVLEKKAKQAGQIAGLTSDEIHQDIRRRTQVAAEKDEQGGIQPSALLRVKRARQCLSQPAGSTHEE